MQNTYQMRNHMETPKARLFLRQILVHHPGEAAQMATSSFAVMPGAETFVSVSKNEVCMYVCIPKNRSMPSNSIGYGHVSAPNPEKNCNMLICGVKQLQTFRFSTLHGVIIHPSGTTSKFS